MLMAGFEGGASEDGGALEGAVAGRPVSAVEEPAVVAGVSGVGGGGTAVLDVVGVVGVPSPLLALPQNLVKGAD